MIKQLLSKALSPYRTFIIYNKNINHLCAFYSVVSQAHNYKRIENSYLIVLV